MNVMSARGQLQAQLGRDHSAPAIRRIAGNPDLQFALVVRHVRFDGLRHAEIQILREKDEDEMSFA
jgi:hypothetical protein